MSLFVWIFLKQNIACVSTQCCDNTEFLTGCIKGQRIFFDVQEQCTAYFSDKILVTIDPHVERHFA